MVFLVEEQGEAFVAAFVASVILCGAAPLQAQTYLVAKQGNCGKQILRPRLFTLGDIYSDLYLALHSVTCILLFGTVLGRSLRLPRRSLRPIFPLPIV